MMLLYLTLSQPTNISLILDMKHFHSIEYDADRTPHLVRVGAGVTQRQLKEALRHTGYHFPIDPGAIDATLGGMMATAASGTTAVRYGTMRENILACQCVLADGTVVRAGSDAVKNAAGYNLVGLMTGSEGTLGVITHLTLQLRPVLEHRMSAVVGFATLHDAANLALQLKLYEIPIYRCELLDSASVQAYNNYSHQSLPVQPTVFLEFQSYSDAAVQEQVQLTRDVLCADLSAVSFEYSGTDHETLWAARHKLYYAAIAARPHATGAIVTDACVPLTRLADLLEATVADVQVSNVVGPCFGHAGDGNLHCILPVRPDEDRATGYWDRVIGVRDRLAERAIAMGGTVTGEHGVGIGKMNLLERQYGHGAVAMMRAIKHALDPLNIMNPGKVLPPVPND
jgi:D-lactate dehydrogenase (cytochrome)